MKTTDFIKNQLQTNLSQKRYNHSLGCADTALKLAKKFNLDEKKAYLAGLVHDCAKNFDNEKLFNIIKNEIKTGFDEAELKNPKTYHAIVGAYLVQRDFEINDEEIISAIRKHTIGSTNMTLFEKIIFLADKIEPNTRPIEYTKQLTDILEKYNDIKGLDLAILKCFMETIKSLIERKLFICPTTIDVYNELIEKYSQIL